MKKFNENKIIKNISRLFNFNSNFKFTDDLHMLKGIGDDSAYWKDKNYAYCTSTDSLVENVHFKLDYFSAIDIGKKSIAVNLSDIAAMGATPLGMLINLGITKKQDERWIDEFYQGVYELSDSYRSPLIGGDLVYSQHLFISVTCIGYRKLDQNSNTEIFLDRSKLNEGDMLYVTGFLGDSRAGLDILNSDTYNSPYKIHEQKLIQSHIYKKPRLDVGLKLIENGITNCIDISDGLLIDSKRLATESGVSININEKSLPISDDLKLAFPDDYLNYALIGGEDYELLFSAPKSMNRSLLDIFKELNIKLSQIGEIRKGQSEIFLDNELTDIKGWDHFENQL